MVPVENVQLLNATILYKEKTEFRAGHAIIYLQDAATLVRVEFLGQVNELNRDKLVFAFAFTQCNARFAENLLTASIAEYEPNFPPKLRSPAPFVAVAAAAFETRTIDVETHRRAQGDSQQIEGSSCAPHQLRLWAKRRDTCTRILHAGAVELGAAIDCIEQRERNGKN
jgi:hypothetical protein